MTTDTTTLLATAALADQVTRWLTPDRWTFGVLARDRDGKTCRPTSSQAAAWCALGAATKLRNRTAALLLNTLYYHHYGQSLEADNDNRGLRYTRRRLRTLAQALKEQAAAAQQPDDEPAPAQVIPANAPEQHQATTSPQPVLCPPHYWDVTDNDHQEISVTLTCRYCGAITARPRWLPAYADLPTPAENYRARHRDKVPV